jgi:cytochrome c oxidase subunit III
VTDDELHVEEIYATRAARDHALHLGMWVFLGSETLLFAGLFGLYAAYRYAYTAEFAAGVAHNNALIGTVNTVVLIVSSFFVAWAIHANRHARRRTAMFSLLAAMGLGATFLVLKFIEYGQHLHEGIAPGRYYASVELPGQGSRTFFTLYYAMTALHGLHVIAGLVILGWLATRVWRRRTVPERRAELELGGLYWHLIDIVWIFLWPLLYLTR